MRYRIALFDADNTLMDFSRSEREALSDCLRARGLPSDDSVIARYSAINDNEWKRLECGETTRDRLRVDRFLFFAREFGFDLDPVRMADDYMEALSKKAYLMDGAEDLVKTVSGHCRLFIITNGLGYVQNKRFNASPLARYFEGVFISENVGCAKPERAFFDHVAANIPSFNPRDTLVIGDSLSSDVKGGINAGIDTCWYAPHGRNAPPDLAITYTVRHLMDIAPIILGD